MPEQIEEPRSEFQLISEELPRGAELWGLTAHNSKVVSGWKQLCIQIPDNLTRCYWWLRQHPTKRIPGRCYELRYKHYAGAWCYEVGSGQRVYYKPRLEQHDVLVYYAGKHPSKVPYPPA